MAVFPMVKGVPSGGSNIAVSDIKAISAHANASWNGTPFKANQILLTTNYYYSGHGTWYITNFDPTTGEVDNTVAWWSEDGGSTWTKNAQYGWTITDTYIEYLNDLSGVVTCYCTFIISDKENIQLE